MKNKILFSVILTFLITTVCLSKPVEKKEDKLKKEKEAVKKVEEKIPLQCNKNSTGVGVLLLPLLDKREKVGIISNVDTYSISYSVKDINGLAKEALIKVHVDKDKITVMPEGIEFDSVDDPTLFRRRISFGCIPFGIEQKIRIKGFREKNGLVELIYNKLFLIDIRGKKIPIIDLVDEIYYEVETGRERETCALTPEEYGVVIAKAGNYKVDYMGKEVKLNGAFKYAGKSEGALKFLWEQVDGPFVTLSDNTISEPYFVPPIPGEYTFKLIVKDDKNISRPDTVTIKILPEKTSKTPLFVYAGGTQTVFEKTPITLKGSYHTNLKQVRDENVKFFWEQISGKKVEMPSKTLRTIGLKDLAPGEYKFKLVVNDGFNTAEDVTTIIVKPKLKTTNKPPIANAGKTKFGKVKEKVLIDGKNSFDPDGDKLNYKWKQVLGPSIDKLFDSNKAEAYFIPTFPGYYKFELEINDGQVSAIDSVAVNVLNGADKEKEFKLVKSYEKIKTASNIVVNSGFAYFVNELLNLQILNVSEPKSIEELGSADLQFDLNKKDIAEKVLFVEGNYAYVIHSSIDEDKDLRIVDVKDKKYPQLIGYFDVAGRCSSIFVRRNFAYITVLEGQDKGLLVLDVSEPAKPKKVSSLSLEKSPVSVWVDSNYAYVGATSQGLLIVDVSSAKKLSIVGSLFNFPYETTQVFIAGDYAFVLYMVKEKEGQEYFKKKFGGKEATLETLIKNKVKTNAFQAINVSNPLKPFEVGYYSEIALFKSIFISGNYAFVGYVSMNGEKKILLLDITDPADIKLITSYQLAENIKNIYVNGSYVFVSADTLYILEF